MSLNERQFNQLKAMGISLWQARKDIFPKNISKKVTSKLATNIAVQTHVTISAQSSSANQQSALCLNDFIKTKLFNDIVNTLNLKPEQIQIKDNTLIAERFSWVMHDEPSQKIELIGHNSNTPNINSITLITPSWLHISKAPRIKQQLWQKICQFIKLKSANK